MRPSCSSLSVFLLPAFLVAQTGSPVESARNGLVLARADHRVEFDAAQRRFVHGAAAMRWRPVLLARGDTEAATFGDVAPHARDGAVHYDHGSCTERYAPWAHGVELSFVFAALPPGAGDLVVRLAAEADEPACATGPHGLCFGAAAARIVWGGVTGIAADGVRARGTITWDGTHVELSLPAAFVATAALPLVLDPTVGTTVPVVSAFATRPDVAGFGSVPGTAVVAYQKDVLLGSSTEVRARPLSGVGNPVGSEFVVTSNGSAPSLTAVPSLSLMVCAFERNGGIMGCALQTNGQVGSLATFASTVNANESPDLGGDATTGAGLCVFHDVTTDAIRARPFALAGLFSLTPGNTVTISTAATLNNVRRPRISRSGGADGRYLVVWENQNVVVGSTSVQIAAVSPTGVVLDTLSLGAGAAPDVDGDGRQWIVAFHRAAATGDDDVVACAVSWPVATAGLVATPPIAVSAVPNVDERHPAVCWLRQSALVGWERSALGSSDTDLFTKTIDAFTCAQCQPAELLANTTQAENEVAFAPVAVAGTFGAAIAWRSGTTSNSIDYTEFRNDDGNLLSLFGQVPCAGGANASGCPRVGNGNFRLRLRDAAPNAISWLVLSPDAISLSCGCTLIADPFHGFVGGGLATNGFGQAEVALAIPNSTQLSGLQFLTQWIVAAPVGACSVLGADFSTAALMIIQ